MKKLYRLLFIPTLFLFNSCNTLISTSVTKSYDPVEYTEDVAVFEQNQPIPGKAELLGHVKIDESRFTLASNCTYNVVINEAKYQAREIGGNAIKITSHTLPSETSSCHKIEAYILRIDSSAVASKAKNGEFESNSLSDNLTATGEVKDAPKYRAAINGGYSFGTAIPSENILLDYSNYKDYYRNLKSGYHFGGEATYFFSDAFGVGLKGYIHKSSNKLDNISDTTGGTTRYGSMSDNITSSYVGPTFSTRFLNQDNNRAILLDLSLGYMGYYNNAVRIDSYKINGQSFGFSLSAGYDIEIAKNLILGFQVSYLYGTLLKYDLNDGVSTKTITLDKEEYESLNRLDFSVGLRFFK